MDLVKVANGEVPRGTPVWRLEPQGANLREHKAGEGTTAQWILFTTPEAACEAYEEARDREAERMRVNARGTSARALAKLAARQKISGQKLQGAGVGNLTPGLLPDALERLVDDEVGVRK